MDLGHSSHSVQPFPLVLIRVAGVQEVGHNLDWSPVYCREKVYSTSINTHIYGQFRIINLTSLTACTQRDTNTGITYKLHPEGRGQFVDLNSGLGGANHHTTKLSLHT